MRCFKLRSKPIWVYIIQISYTPSISEGIFQYIYLPICSSASGRRALCLPICGRCQFPTQVLNPLGRTYIYIYIYIVIHRLAVLLYHNSSAWLDMCDASSWDENPGDLMSVRYRPSQHKQRNFTYIFIYIYPYRIMESSFQENTYLYIYIYIYAYMRSTPFWLLLPGSLWHKVVVPVCIKQICFKKIHIW